MMSNMYPRSLALAKQLLVRRTAYRTIAVFLRPCLVRSRLRTLDFCSLCILAYAPRRFARVDLGRVLDLEKSATAKLVRRLHTQKFIRVQRDSDDKRRFWLALTETGAQCLGKVEQNWTRTLRMGERNISGD
jgi:DNA-binding MarR family transcriptional regulator